MNENEKTDDMVNTTDCLEAVSAFKGMKNFLFIIALICLLLLQGIFWLERFGLIDKTTCTQAACGRICSIASQQICPVAKAADTIEKQAEKITEDLASQTEAEPAEASEAPVAAETEEKETKPSKIPRPACRHIAYMVKACNFVLIIAVFLYCITLFMSIKISLTGRLGGINHISRAFFLSIFAFALLLPWQCCFPYVIRGAIYRPAELLCGQTLTAGTSMICGVFCYLRFTGLWLIVVLLLICAQLRSRKWTQATLRRLGILD